MVLRLDSADGGIADMVQTMAKAFEFARDAQSLTERTLKFRETVDELLHETIACSHFVEQCASGGIPGADKVQLVSKYEARFLDLKKILDSGISRSATIADRDSGMFHSQSMLEWFGDV